jgi:hypothetical protein
MKIYQIHEFGGQWEDYYDYIVGTYLHKDRAELEMKKLVDTEEAHQKRYEKCQNCPIGDLDLQEDTFDAMKDACSTYCNRSQIYEELYGFGCENEEHYWDNNNYKIKEVEVIE